MKRFKKLALTAAALAALAVGGAAFAQAQSAGTAPQTQVQTHEVETGTPGDPADAPSLDKAGGVDRPEAGDKPDAAGEKDSPDAIGDQETADDQGAQSD